MKKVSRLLAFASAFSCCLVNQAWAQAVTGPYVDLGGGYNLLADIHAHSHDPAQPRTNYRFGAGFVGAGSVGWGFGNGLRAEVEGAYDYNSVINRVKVPTAERTTGNQGTYGVFGNVFYDVDLNKIGIPVDAVQPYVGAGVGVLWTHFSPITSVADNNASVFRLGGTGENFAYQGIAGLGFPVKAVPGLKLTVDYRFIGIDVRSGAVGSDYTRTGVTPGTSHLSPAFLHQFTIGIAYAFEHPAPARPPESTLPEAPAPTAARTYLVFFDWDNSALTPRAREIVAEAAGNATHVATTRIEVNGYADTSHALPEQHGHAYNMTLSQHRASNVQAELVRDGVPSNAITIQAYGDSHLLVQSGANIREPQNRRVEIILD